MRIIIGGAGEVGRGVARALQDEGQDIVLVDPDPATIKEVQSIDAFVLLGDVTRREILKEAGIIDAAVFIAATGSDERNMLACALARDLLEEELLGLWKDHGIDDVNRAIACSNVCLDNICVADLDSATRD